jgi:hypothetical protein
LTESRDLEPIEPGRPQTCPTSSIPGSLTAVSSIGFGSMESKRGGKLHFIELKNEPRLPIAQKNRRDSSDTVGLRHLMAMRAIIARPNTLGMSLIEPNLSNQSSSPKHSLWTIDKGWNSRVSDRAADRVPDT